MIDYLIEIIFKNVPVEEIGSLLKNLSENGKKIVSSNCTCNSLEINWNIEESIEKIFVDNKNFSLFINLEELKRDGVCLKNCCLAVYKNENAINLELNFQLSDLGNCKINELAKNLMKLAKRISVDYHIVDYFCGLEPAHDIKTRLFTNEQLGPFSLK